MDGHGGEFMAPACTGHCGDTGGGKPPPPTVPSMQHASIMAGSERDASAHRAMQEGGGTKETATDRGGGEGYHFQSLQRVRTPPGYGDLFQILGAGDLSGG